MNDPDELERSPCDPGLEHIIETIGTTDGFDVRGYKRFALYRQIRKRIADSGFPNAAAYLARLETDRQEYTHLVNTLLSNSTEFFCDPEAWLYLRDECLRPLVQRRRPGEPLRFWCVGCATGEEPYSLAIGLAELLGERSLLDVKIYATDMDDDALTQARSGIYARDDLRNVSPERLGLYFDELPGRRHVIRRDLRASVIFGRHNALVDPPISRQDVLICRNLLIYFDTETQQQLLPRFHYALREEGHLFLGKADSILRRSTLFRPLAPQFRIFQRVPKSGPAATLLPPLARRKALRDGGAGQPQDVQNYPLHALTEQALDPVIWLDASGRVTQASPSAREFFRFPDGFVGQSFTQLDEELRPPALRVALKDARTSGRPAEVEEMRLPQADGSALYLRMRIYPILDPHGNLLHLMLWGRDLTEVRHLKEELLRVRQVLGAMGIDLPTTTDAPDAANATLHSSPEVLKPANDEPCPG